MKRFFLVVFTACALSGCGTFSAVSNWPIFSATATSVVLVNNTSDTYLMVYVNGRVATKKAVKPGEQCPLGFRNFSNHQKHFTVLVMAYDSGENMLGTTSTSFSLGTYQADAKVWVINSCDIQQRH